MAGPLNRKQIRERVDRQKLLEGFDDSPRFFEPASYELRVGSYFDAAAGRSVDLHRDEPVAVVPGGFVLLGTVEKVNMPNDLLGLLYLRSSYARRGFVPWFMGLVDPGYHGGLTLALHNLSSELLPINGYEPICHVVFQQLAEPVDEGYSGAYQGAAPGATPDRSGSTVVKVIGKVRVIGSPLSSGGTSCQAPDPAQ